MAWIVAGSPQQPIEVPEGTPGSTPGSPPKILPEYTAWLRTSISSYEVLAKTLVGHRAEKGRIVESVVKTALRAILPGRFSIGTGFAITSSGATSSQLDLVIYDSFSNAPIILEGGTGLFPIECIYGFVEVKSVLDGDAIDSATKAIGLVRGLSAEKRYAGYGERIDDAGNRTIGQIELEDHLPPRSFVFAINSAFGSIDTLRSKLSEATVQNGAHIHGLTVLEKDWFIRQRPFQNPHEFDCKEGNSLSAFCAAVLNSIQSIIMLPASMKRYLGLG